MLNFMGVVVVHKAILRVPSADNFNNNTCNIKCKLKSTISQTMALS